MNLGAVNYHRVVLEEVTPEVREHRENHSQKSQWWKEVNERGNARLPKRSTEAKNWDDDEQKIYEKLTQLNKVTKTCQDAKEHSQQQAVKSVANSRREEHTQQQEKIKRTERAKPTAGSQEHNQHQAETYEENNDLKKEVGPMTRNKDTESHQRRAAEQALKVAEKAREHQVEIQTEIEVEELGSCRVEKAIS